MVRVETLKIAHVVFSFDYGGLERRILRLIDGLTPLGAEFTIVSLRPSQGRFLGEREHVRHIVLDASPGIDFSAVRRLARILRDDGIHIVHSHNWVSMLEGILAGTMAGTPAVLHGEHGASRFEPDQLRLKRTLAQAALARAAHALVPVNEAIRDRLCEVWRVDKARCTVIRNGVDTALFTPTAHQSKGPVTIGSISRLEPIKNFKCLIRAVHHLNRTSDEPGYRLLIVGDGSERAELENLVAELGCGESVLLPGATNDPQDWYRRFDIYVNCSFSEGMSNTVLEAMACGLPIVATDVAGHRDWLKADENAVFFASDDFEDLARALHQFGIARATREAVGKNNRERVVEQFSQERFIRDYVGLYQQLLAAKNFDWPASA